MSRQLQRLGLILVVAILTVTSVASLVHRHSGNLEEQGCVLCHVRHEPGIANVAAVTLDAPVIGNRILEIAEIQSQSRDSVPVRSGRAPPTSF